MKMVDLIDRTREGVERPEAEKAMIRGMLTSTPTKCAHCGEMALCAYYIQLDAFFCSDECRHDHG